MLAALSFLTSIGRPTVPTARALRWFPVVGALIGLLLGGLWWGARQVWPAPVAAALVVAGDLAVTGLLHFDGLVDSADGLLPHLPAARRLEVMAQPDAGAFGIGVGAAVLLVRWAALASMRPAVLLLGGAWCLSRTGMAAVARYQPYARGSEGLASAFLGAPGQPAFTALLIGTGGAFALACIWKPLPGAVSLVAGAVAFTAVVGLARRRLGGYTGDVLGAGGILAETAALLVASARW